MRAMILAAGLGKRMLPLTADAPKPLLKVGEQTLIEHQIDKLVAAGVSAIVINHFHLGGMIEPVVGDGKRWGIPISYSREPILLDTAGGIIKALPQLQDDSFIVVNADIWTDFDFARLQPVDGNSCLAHLVLVAGAEHNPDGDFALDDAGLVQDRKEASGLTFSGISVMHKNLFSGLPIQPRSVVPLLKAAMADARVSGEKFDGEWMDIGTPERLADVNNKVSQANQSGDANR